ncbi:hypothetical protein [Vibrio phage LP.2]|nr:hypothetical protein [Vibrio phage LP.2]
MIDVQFDGYHWEEVITYETNEYEEVCLKLVDDTQNKPVAYIYELSTLYH